MSYKYFIPKLKENPWDHYWSDIDIKKNIKTCETDELLPIIKKYIKKTDKILDAGCGLGRWVIFLTKEGYDILGVDNFGEILKMIKEFDPLIKVKVADVRQLPFKNEYFDGYLSFGVVEHFEEGPLIALKEAKRVLKKGGVIILETPYYNTLRRLRRIGYYFKTPIRFIKNFLNKSKKKDIEIQFYEYRYTAKELRKFLKDLNFKIIGNFFKDINRENESIGLWSDYWLLRDKSGKPFKINKIGSLIKKIFSPFKFLYCGCVIIVAKKE